MGTVCLSSIVGD